MKRFDFDETDSTSRRARELASAHRGEVLLCSAATQTQGRGRSGRAWASPRGGAWFTIAWPVGDAAVDYEALPLVVGMAVSDAIIAVAQPGLFVDRVRIKWPNDVLIDDMKVAGVLCERDMAADDGTGTVFVGVGVNVDFDPTALPTDLRAPATTLRHLLGRSIDPAVVVDEASTRIVTALTAFESQGLSPHLLDAITQRLAWRGCEVTLTQGGTRRTGRLAGLDEQGRLLLDTANGVAHYSVGEIEHLSPLDGL